jgi:two-component system, response regulator
MNWKNAVRDSLPTSSRKVLISLHGVYYVAYFDSQKDEFFIVDETGPQRPLKHKTEQVYWTDLTTPQNMRKREFYRILIAEDDIDDQVLMKEALKECKIEIRIDTVFDGVQTLDFLLKRDAYSHLEYEPDLLLLDLNLPLKDGFAVLKELKKHPDLKTMPVYVISTSRNADDVNRVLDLGANGFYTKGSKSKDILQIVKELCNECFEETVSSK